MTRHIVSIGEVYGRSLDKGKKRNPEAAFLLEEINNEIVKAEQLQDETFGKHFMRMNDPACREYVDKTLRPLYSKKSRVTDQILCEHKHTHEEGGIRLGFGDVIDDTREVCDDCGSKVGFHNVSLPKNIVEIL